MTTLLISAGDASGDLHAAALVAELKRRDPALRVLGLGGPNLARAGAELVVEQREIAIGGLRFLWSDVRRVVGAWRRMTRALRETQPELVVLVDSPDFNIPLAARAKREGARVLYYIGPQLWAWRRGRIHKIARRVDQMALIFPFETEVYEGAGLPVEFVGHPLLDRLQGFNETNTREDCRRSLGFDAARPLVALLPGSRRNEVRGLLPLYLAVARALHARDARIVFSIAQAPSIEREIIDEVLAREPLPDALELSVVTERRYELLRAADAVLSKPGTATLETALLGTPLVVAGRTGWFTWLLLRRLLRVSTLTLPNLIAGCSVAPEFLQQRAEPQVIAAALQARLRDPLRSAQQRAFALVKNRLGGHGATARTAEIAMEMLRGRAST